MQETLHYTSQTETASHWRWCSRYSWPSTHINKPSLQHTLHRTRQQRRHGQHRQAHTREEVDRPPGPLHCRRHQLAAPSPPCRGHLLPMSRTGLRKDGKQTTKTRLSMQLLGSQSHLLSLLRTHPPRAHRSVTHQRNIASPGPRKSPRRQDRTPSRRQTAKARTRTTFDFSRQWTRKASGSK